MVTGNRAEFVKLVVDEFAVCCGGGGGDGDDDDVGDCVFGRARRNQAERLTLLNCGLLLLVLLLVVPMPMPMPVLVLVPASARALPMIELGPQRLTALTRLLNLERLDKLPVILVSLAKGTSELVHNPLFDGRVSKSLILWQS